MKIINLTPHALNVIGIRDRETILDSDGVARVKTNSESVNTILDERFQNIFHLTKTMFGEVEGLPEPINGTAFIVSRIVKNACQDRDDVWCPGPLIRDENGQPKGCMGFSL